MKTLLLRCALATGLLALTAGPLAAQTTGTGTGTGTGTTGTGTGTGTNQPGTGTGAGTSGTSSTGRTGTTGTTGTWNSSQPGTASPSGSTLTNPSSGVTQPGTTTNPTGTGMPGSTPVQVDPVTGQTVPSGAVNPNAPRTGNPNVPTQGNPNTPGTPSPSTPNTGNTTRRPGDGGQTYNGSTGTMTPSTPAGSGSGSTSGGGTTGGGVMGDQGQPIGEPSNNNSTTGQYRDQYNAGAYVATPTAQPGMDDPRYGQMPMSSEDVRLQVANDTRRYESTFQAGNGMTEMYSTPRVQDRMVQPLMVAGKPVTVRLRNDTRESFNFAAGDMLGAVPGGQSVMLTVPAGTQIRFGGMEADQQMLTTLDAGKDGKWVNVRSIKRAINRGAGEKPKTRGDMASR